MAGSAIKPRALALVAVLALPMAGLALLVAEPGLDVHWEHHPAHFWLVVLGGAACAGLAYATGTTAHRRGDARVLLISLGFLTGAGFLGLHALATPGVLLERPNTGFALATPVGLVIASVFAALSSLELSRERAAAVVRRHRLIRGALFAAMAVWGAVSLAELPPLDDPDAPERASGPLLVPAVAGVALYALAVTRYLRLLRRRPSRLVLGLAIACTLMAEALVAVAFGRNWHATWWEWHLLIVAGVGLVAIYAHRQWHEERFSDLYLDETAAGEREVSVLFADLAGFTSFSERHEPTEVAQMLNEYFERVIPPIAKRLGGEIDRIIGDALMVTFNRRGDQPDHAERAARAALAIQAATEDVAAAHPGWPRFRVGVNSGPAMVGVLGAAGGRTLTVIGDTVNLASRLEGQAPPGGVAIGAATARLVPAARTEPLGRLEVKGKSETVEAFLLTGLDPAPGPGEGS